MLASAEDVAGRVACGRAAFPHSRMTTEKYEAARRTTLYRPALDWLIFAPDGRVAAFALGWFDSATLGLELEPVGVAPEFQRAGWAEPPASRRSGRRGHSAPATG
jgi:hypothetical protein